MGYSSNIGVLCILLGVGCSCGGGAPEPTTNEDAGAQDAGRVLDGGGAPDDAEADAALDAAEPTVRCDDPTFTVALTLGEHAASAPTVADSGDAYGVAWAEQVDGETVRIFFARVSRDGELIDAPVAISDGALNAVQPSLVWNGTEYGIVWVESPGGGLRFCRLASTGDVLDGCTSPQRVTGATRDPSLAWTGDGYAVVWRLYSDLSFVRLDAGGEPVGPRIELTDAGDAWHPSLVWTGEELAVAWRDGRHGSLEEINEEIYFARLDESGSALSPSLRVTDAAGASWRPALEWTGDGYALLWQDDRAQAARFTLYHQRLDASGMPDGDSVALTEGSDAKAPAASWSHGVLRAAWIDNRSGRAQVQMGVLEDAGQLEDVHELPSEPQAAVVDLVWSGDGGVVAWSSAIGAPIHVAALRCR